MIQLCCAFRIYQYLSLNCGWNHWTQLFTIPPSPSPQPRPQPWEPRASLVAQTVKHLPAMWEIWVQSLGQEDPLEECMATHSSILAWRIPWIEKSGGLRSMGSQRVRNAWATKHTLRRLPWETVCQRRSGTGRSQEGGLGFRAWRGEEELAKKSTKKPQQERGKRIVVGMPGPVWDWQLHPLEKGCLRKINCAKYDWEVKEDKVER